MNINDKFSYTFFLKKKNAYCPNVRKIMMDDSSPSPWDNTPALRVVSAAGSCSMVSSVAPRHRPWEVVRGTASDPQSGTPPRSALGAAAVLRLLVTVENQDYFMLDSCALFTGYVL